MAITLQCTVPCYTYLISSNEFSEETEHSVEECDECDESDDDGTDVDDDVGGFGGAAGGDLDGVRVRAVVRFELRAVK